MGDPGESDSDEGLGFDFLCPTKVETETPIRSYDSDSSDDDFLFATSEPIASKEDDNAQSQDNLLSEPPSSSSAAELERTRFDLRATSASTNEPTHHDLDLEALQTFIYPVNKPIRDYQRNIVCKALVRNVVCALPTGLGKTYIASVVMLNWLRWTKSAKIIFVAPTRPLVAQQARSFLEISGVSLKETGVLLQGVVDRNGRAEEWKKKRVFFSTAQTIYNDLDSGIIDPMEIVCLVLDEAHRATGEHAYVNVVEKIYSVNQSFRILALTATPSGKLEGVQAIIDTLHISQTEIRTEDSLDIRKYTHARNLEKHVVKFSDEQEQLLDLVAAAMKEQTGTLQQAGITYTNDITMVSHFALLQNVNKYMHSQTIQHAANKGRAFMLRSIGMLAAKVAYAVGLLKTHGIYPFYERMKTLKVDLEKSKGVTAKKLLSIHEFSEIFRVCENHIYSDLTKRERNPLFVGHPKLRHLIDIVGDFFLQHGADSRAIIFSEFRESGAEIIWLLSVHCPGFVRANMFVGQATRNVPGQETVKGMTQKQQHEMLEKFRDGSVNVLVATSIAEEGLDIGQVDLIICYDQSKSPIRMVQRMGRTGRKRAGYIHMLLTEKENSNMTHALSGHKYIRKRIDEARDGNKSTLQLRYHKSARIIPNDVVPHYTELMTELPDENREAMAEGDILLAMKPPKLKRTRTTTKSTGAKSRTKTATKTASKTGTGDAAEPAQKSRKIQMDLGDIYDPDSSLDQFGFQSAAELVSKSHSDTGTQEDLVSSAISSFNR